MSRKPKGFAMKTTAFTCALVAALAAGAAAAHAGGKK
jgi:hypothetical protein